MILLLVLCCSCFSQAQISIDKDSAMLAIEARIVEPVIPEYEVSITRFGARGDSVTDCKMAFDRAMKHLEKRKGGRLTVPPGVFTVNGPIHFTDHVNLHLAKGAKIRFGDNPENYLPMVLTSWEGTMLYNYSPLIYARDKRDISITGEGVIDGEGHSSWAQWKAIENAGKQLSRDLNHQGTDVEKRNFGEGHYLRPQLLQFLNCKNILLEGVRFEDSPFWCVHMLRSKNITIRGISYHAHNKNNDGIDLEYASDVLIEEVEFDNADDNIAIKAGRDDEGRGNAKMPSQDILIRNNRFKGLHALVIGSEMSAGVQRVFVQDNKASGYLKRGIYFKTNSDRGGYIRDIHISGLDLLEVEDCLFMTANYHGEGDGSYPSKISDISILDVTCLNASNTGIVIEGFNTSKVENVFLENINIQNAKNGLTLTQTKNVQFSEVVIGEKAGTPSAVSH